MKRKLLLGLIFIAHALALFFLFSRSGSDFVRFALPTSAAFFLNALAAPKMKLWMAAALAFFSFWAGMVAALNTYGS